MEAPDTTATSAKPNVLLELQPCNSLKTNIPTRPEITEAVCVMGKESAMPRKWEARTLQELAAAHIEPETMPQTMPVAVLEAEILVPSPGQMQRVMRCKST